MGKSWSGSLLVVLVLCAAILAGCSGKESQEAKAVAPGERPQLAAGKGAIAGLVHDERYRPVPGALVLLTPAGLTATADSEGQFGFTDLDPGPYTLQVQVANHEGAPTGADVVAGQYKDVEIEARRIFTDSGYVITLEASVFIPCAVASPAVLGTVNCLGDISGDSYRTGFVTKFNASKVKWLVGEIKFSKADNYVFVLRPTTSNSQGDAFNYTIIHGGDYGKVILKAGINETYNRNPWNAGKDMQATLFFSGQVDGAAPDPICSPVPPPNNLPPCRTIDAQDGFGIGATFAIKAKMILSAFVGDPPIDLNEYHVLA